MMDNDRKSIPTAMKFRSHIKISTSLKIDKPPTEYLLLKQNRISEHVLYSTVANDFPSCINGESCSSMSLVRVYS